MKRQEGFRAIGNPLFKALMAADLTRAEYKVILAVIDETSGFQRAEAPISYSQFMAKTGLSRPAISHALKQVRKKGIIDLSNKGTFHKDASVYSLNPPECWTGKVHVTSESTPLVKQTLPVGGATSSENFTSENAKTLPVTSKVLEATHPLIKEIKETIKETPGVLDNSKGAAAPLRTPAGDEAIKGVVDETYVRQAALKFYRPKLLDMGYTDEAIDKMTRQELYANARPRNEVKVLDYKAAGRAMKEKAGREGGEQ